MIVEPSITLGGIASIVAIAASAYGINAGVRSRHRENQQDAQEREDRLVAKIDKTHDAYEDRLKTVEVTVRDFMPRGEIERMLLHEKTNRVQCDDAQQRQIDQLARDGTDTKVELGRLRERSDGIAADVGEIKALVKEQGRDTAARLDKMADTMSAIGQANR